MSILSEAKIEAADLAADTIDETIPEAAADYTAPAIDLSFLKCKTGEGSIENYIDSPLNFKHSYGIAQCLRGFTGLLGALDLAVIDIFIGTLNYIKERKINETSAN